jgi:hypothetical protein
MYSYHIVAELRQFRGACAAAAGCIHKGLHRPAGTVSCRCGLTRMDKFFLAMMVSAVLLLIVAADLLVNGPALQRPSADVAYVLPPSGRFVR